MLSSRKRCNGFADGLVILVTKVVFILVFVVMFSFVYNTSCFEMGLAVLVVFCSVYSASYIQYANEPI